ncbi:MAG: ATP-binding cassette domain-containing protein [Oscillospiraceae bacterium]|nr:ATP-binding cassette domain-containing protein [Oscillospiraceae bacterium]MDD4368967.1 ATP-binding cassette domain-containing protein [Oscillospiraceae bacterium]
MQQPATDQAATPVLEVADLSKHYGDKTALDHISVTFAPGLTGLLGPNGAGKSTLMNLIADNVKRESGTITYGGQDILTLGQTFRQLLGYMSQEQGLYEQFSAREFLQYMANLKGLPRAAARTQIEQLLQTFHLQRDAHRKLGGFSGGMRQRVLLCQALLGSPRVLLLDEPSAGLDPQERLNLRGYLANLARRRVVLLSTHIASDVESIASQIVLLSQGRLLTEGSPAKLMQTAGAASLEQAYLYFVGALRS